MFVGIGMAIICLIIFIVKLPGWIKSGKIDELKDKRTWKIIGLTILGSIVFFILLIVLTINILNSEKTVYETDIIGTWQFESIENVDNPNRQDENTKTMKEFLNQGVKIFNYFNSDGTFKKSIIVNGNETVIQKGKWEYDFSNYNIKLVIEYLFDGENESYSIEYRYAKLVSCSDEEMIYENNVEGTNYKTALKRVESALERHNSSTLKRKTDVEKDGLKGRVARIKIDGNLTDVYNYDGFKTNNYDYLSGRLYSQTVYEYQGGNLIRSTEKYNESMEEWDDRTYIITYKKDDAGNIIEAYSRDTRGDLSGKEVFKYDSNGNIIERAYFSSIDGESFELGSKCIFIYDNKENCIEFKMYGSVNVHEKRVYDLDGNLIESRSYDTSGNLEHKCLYKYKRDSRGNWIEKNCSCTDGEKFITKREIEYY